MNKRKKILHLALILFSGQLIGMEPNSPDDTENTKNINSEAKEFIKSIANNHLNWATHKINHEEAIFLRQLIDWTHNHKRLVALQLVMRESLNTGSAFYKELARRFCNISLVSNMDYPFIGKTKSYSWHPSGNTICCVNENGVLELWNVCDKHKPTLISTISKDLNIKYTAAAFDPEGKKISAGTDDGKIYLINFDDKSLEFLDEMDVRFIFWSHDGKIIFACLLDEEGVTPSTICRWKWDDFKGKYLYSGGIGRKNANHEIAAAALNPDGENCVVGYDILGEIDVFGISLRTLPSDRTNNDNQDDEPGFRVTIDGPETGVRSLSWSPDGKYLLLCAPGEGMIKLYYNPDLTDSVKLKLIKVLSEREGRVSSIAWSPNGKYALSGSENNTIKLWDMTDKRNPKILGSYNDLVEGDSIKWCPNGQYALYVSGKDGLTKLLDLSSIVDLQQELLKSINKTEQEKPIGTYGILLLKSILEYRKKQEDINNSLYNPQPWGFRITSSKTKEIFKALPEQLQKDLITKGYAEID